MKCNGKKLLSEMRKNSNKSKKDFNNVSKGWDTCVILLTQSYSLRPGASTGCALLSVCMSAVQVISNGRTSF